MQKNLMRPCRESERLTRTADYVLLKAKKETKQSKSTLIEYAIINSLIDKNLVNNYRKYQDNKIAKHDKKAIQLFDKTSQLTTAINDYSVQVRRIGNNVNQIAKGVNKGNSLTDSQLTSLKDTKNGLLEANDNINKIIQSFDKAVASILKGGD